MKKFKDIYEYKIAKSSNDFYKGMPIDPVGTGVASEKAVLDIFEEFGADQEYPAYYDKRTKKVTFTAFENTGQAMVMFNSKTMDTLSRALKNIKGEVYIDYKDGSGRVYVSAPTSRKIDDSDKVEV